MSQFVAIDIETTGLNQREDKIIELAALLYDLDPKTGDVVVEEDGEWTMVIEPGTAIPQFIFDLTGLKNADFEGAPSIDAVADEFLAFINAGETLVTYNGKGFDLAFLAREFGEAWVAYDGGGDHIDMLEIVRRPEVGKDWKGKGAHKLPNVYKRLRPGDIFTAHRALGDCRMLAHVHSAVWTLTPHVFDAAPDPFLDGSEVQMLLQEMSEAREAVERFDRAERLLKSYFALQHPATVHLDGFEVVVKETKGRKRLVKELKHLIPAECYEVGPGSTSVKIQEVL